MKWFLSGLVIAFVVGIAALPPDLLQKKVQQPIAFNHLVHKDLDCASCHEFVKEQAFAGLPSLDVCLGCHESAVTENPEEEKIRQLAAEGKPVVWQRLFRQPSHVFYSHRRHVTIAKLDCQNCHGKMGESQSPPQSVHNLTMEECISCHEAKGVRAGCVDCHR
ncbi:MAG: hypothetical protein HY645_05150 [Acidobacteria bacterium]|nr:hypothetical protein [Acidobacteriota bacterium]